MTGPATSEGYAWKGWFTGWTPLDHLEEEVATSIRLAFKKNGHAALRDVVSLEYRSMRCAEGLLIRVTPPGRRSGVGAYGVWAAGEFTVLGARNDTFRSLLKRLRAREQTAAAVTELVALRLLFESPMVPAVVFTGSTELQEVTGVWLDSEHQNTVTCAVRDGHSWRVSCLVMSRDGIDLRSYLVAPDWTVTNEQAARVLETPVRTKRYAARLHDSIGGVIGADVTNDLLGSLPSKKSPARVGIAMIRWVLSMVVSVVGGIVVLLTEWIGSFAFMALLLPSMIIAEKPRLWLDRLPRHMTYTHIRRSVSILAWGCAGFGTMILANVTFALLLWCLMCVNFIASTIAYGRKEGLRYRLFRNLERNDVLSARLSDRTIEWVVLDSVVLIAIPIVLWKLATLSGVLGPEVPTDLYGVARWTILATLEASQLADLANLAGRELPKPTLELGSTKWAFGAVGFLTLGLVVLPLINRLRRRVQIRREAIAALDATVAEVVALGRVAARPLRAVAFGGSDATRQRAAILSLGLIADQDSVPQLKQLAYGRVQSRPTAESARLALALLGDDSPGRASAAVELTPTFVRMNAQIDVWQVARAIAAETPDSSCIPHLVAFSEMPNLAPATRWRAVLALLRTPSQPAVVDIPMVLRWTAIFAGPGLLSPSTKEERVLGDVLTYFPFWHVYDELFAESTSAKHDTSTAAARLYPHWLGSWHRRHGQDGAVVLAALNLASDGEEAFTAWRDSHPTGYSKVRSLGQLGFVLRWLYMTIATRTVT